MIGRTLLGAIAFVAMVSGCNRSSSGGSSTGGAVAPQPRTTTGGTEQPTTRPAEATAPSGGPVACGPTTCRPGQVCCNPSCGICTDPGGMCTQQFCEPTADAARPGAAAGGPSAGAAGPACTADSDCRAFSDYCTGCDCRALARAAPDPTCAGPGVRCIADPCAGKRAVCDPGTHVCVVR